MHASNILDGIAEGLGLQMELRSQECFHRDGSCLSVLERTDRLHARVVEANAGVRKSLQNTFPGPNQPWGASNYDHGVRGGPQQ